MASHLVERLRMKTVTNLGATCIRCVLAALAAAEIAIVFVADFSNYQHDRAVLIAAASMTLFCLWRLRRSQQTKQRH